MPKFQLPPLKDEKLFEEFTCDLFNTIGDQVKPEPGDYQIFGVKGQNQRGIDIYSSKRTTAIQCKLKDIRKKDDQIRQQLKVDILTDVEKARKLNLEISRFIVASTFRDDTLLQEFVHQLKAGLQLPFEVYYWGWDILTRHAEQYSNILTKYFPHVDEQQKQASANANEFGLEVMHRITSGKQLVDIVGAVHAYGFENDEVENENEAEVIGYFFDNLKEYGEIIGMDIYDNSERIKLGLTFNGYLKQVEELGFLVFGERQKQPMPGSSGKNASEWDVAVIYVIRKTNPMVINMEEFAKQQNGSK